MGEPTLLDSVVGRVPPWGDQRESNPHSWCHKPAYYHCTMVTFDPRFFSEETCYLIYIDAVGSYAPLFLYGAAEWTCTTLILLTREAINYLTHSGIVQKMEDERDFPRYSCNRDPFTRQAPSRMSLVFRPPSPLSLTQAHNSNTNNPSNSQASYAIPQ